MKKILISEAGGAPSVNVVKSIREINKDLQLIGVSSDKYLLALSDVDKRYLIPPANSPSFLKVFKYIVNLTKPNAILSQNDAVIEILSRERENFKTMLFLPRHKTILNCHNKFVSYHIWKKAGISVPKTLLIKNSKDLKQAFTNFNQVIWLRAMTSWSGKGSVLVKNYDFAKSWIDFYKGWGNFTAAEYLSPNSVTWMSIWHKGSLIVAQGRKRVEWRFGHHSISGVTGQTGVAVTIEDPKIDFLAQKAILSIDKKPHGIFSVDMTYDSKGAPNPTEINIGRFFATSHFFTAAGLNMTEVVLKILLDKQIPKFQKKINPLRPNLVWIRQIDTEPKLFDLKQIRTLEKGFYGIKKKLKI